MAGNGPGLFKRKREVIGAGQTGVCFRVVGVVNDGLDKRVGRLLQAVSGTAAPVAPSPPAFRARPPLPRLDRPPPAHPLR